MKEEEHMTDMPHCWCNPVKRVFPNGNMQIIHNYTEDMEKPNKSEESLAIGNHTTEIRGILMKYMNEWPNGLIVDFENLLNTTVPKSDILRVVAELEEEAIEVGNKYGDSYYQGYINTLESIRSKLNLTPQGE